MAVRDQLNQDLHAALRAADEPRKTAIRTLLAAIHNAEIEAGGSIDDAAVAAILSREARQRRESIAEFRKGGRDDLVAKEEADLDFVATYLPDQMTRDAIETAARAVIDRVGAKGPADRGRVMAAIMPELRGKADGGEINAVVSELLAGLDS